MNIVVCIKQVVDTNDIKWTKNNTIDRDGVQSIVNPCDVLAIETALRLKTENDKVTVVTMGPPQAKEALKIALAMGCDEAVLLSDKKFSGSDTVATSRTLATAIKQIEPNYDLIICGQYASDGDTAQTGPSIAQKLGVEQITYVTEIAKVNLEKNSLCAIRTTDETVEVVETPLPALICVCECPYEGRNILIDGYIKSQESEIKVLNADDLNLSKEEIGVKGSPTWVSKAFRAVLNRENKILNANDFEDKSKVQVLEDIISSVKNEKNKLEETTSTLKSIIENDYKNSILIWGEVNSNQDLLDVVYQLASKANELSSQIENCKISVICAGTKTEEYVNALSLYGVDELITLKSSLLEVYNTKNYATSILQYIDKNLPTIFLIGATKQGRDLAPQISSALNTGLTADCTGLNIGENLKLEATRPTFGGELMATILCKTLPQMATVRAGVFETKKVCQSQQTKHVVFEPQYFEPSKKIILKSTPIIKDETSLEYASIVLAGGKGLKDRKTFDKLRELAKLIGAQVGATRKAVDAQLANYNEQVGQTGKTISPDVYIAFGVSGAIQHCVGIENAKKIIAINIDEKAPIIKSADLTIIANENDVIDEWLSKLKQN